jgi:hypothetical protein
MTDSTTSPEFEIPPLPAGVTIERVYADLMKYLMENTRQFFEKTTADGKDIWARVRDTIVIVLATPNGWDMREQATLRRAAIRASLVTNENAGHLLQFVTESEASVHYAIANDAGKWLKRRGVFAVIDCGGSTVDTTIYQCMSTDPLRLQEACPSKCVQVFRSLHLPCFFNYKRVVLIIYEAGGIFVNREVEKMLKTKLKNSLYDHPEILKSMLVAFENDVSSPFVAGFSPDYPPQLKPSFDGRMDTYDLKFGGIRETDPSLKIHKGRIMLSNQDLKPVFDRITNQIIASCSDALIRQRTKVE